MSASGAEVKALRAEPPIKAAKINARLKVDSYVSRETGCTSRTGKRAATRGMAAYDSRSSPKQVGEIVHPDA